ncbi:phenylacetic acid degradation PaaB family protein [Halobellus ruber]|uniref:Phenylacetic acid degradation PaaB family protein n=1 Tax=Halobellus ruber TaxID=2761102 RepID=A0A7J9SIM6_9EURY|nr:phenylacetic acid degradation PaaB family protein [Halobellus ruber]MBB6646362.1 phenylacetic acid degradation PaaB family protein [Halobellus ruber]
MKYHVFTRINAGDDLMHVGTVQADSDRLARIYAHRTYDEEDWDFIGVVREENLIEVEERPIPGGRSR